MGFAHRAAGAGQAVIVSGAAVAVEVPLSFLAQQAPPGGAAVRFRRAVPIIAAAGDGQSPHFLAGRVASSPVSNIIQGPGAFLDRRPLFTFHFSPHGADTRGLFSIVLSCSRVQKTSWAERKKKHVFFSVTLR